MYGWEQSMKFAKSLSENGICVVSGMAMGIDKAAHIGAKDEKGKTIAVLGGGLNKIYPEENKALFYEIIESGGCVITEYAPNEEVKSTNFRRRNRIISGLALGTLVVQATFLSGTLITARHTIEQKKPLFCIPSNLDEEKGVGTNDLIKKGAILTTSVNDIFKELNINKSVKETYEGKEKINIDKKYKNVYNVLENIPITVDEISRRSKTDIAETSNILTMLEIQGVIEYYVGNRYALRR